MKKCFTLIIILSVFQLSKAQVANSSFENWFSGTNTFSFPPFIPVDTFVYTSPADWTCSNSITMSAGLHHTQLADSSATSFAGNKSLYLRTDSIYINAAGIYLTIPGFVVNGTFPLSLSDILNGSGSLNPSDIHGAGVPFSQKLKSFSFRLKYTPVTNDSCLMWAVLRKGSEVVADAKFISTQARPNFDFIEKNFTYYTCSTPDTLVILLCSSNPNFSTLGSGSTGLNSGSQLWVDSVQVTNLPNNYNFAPIAKDDFAYTTENTSKTVNVLANDTDCENATLTVSVFSNARHGNAVTDVSQNIVYTPAAGYSGKDTVIYALSDGANTVYATLALNIFQTSAIYETHTEANIYPNPANQLLTIETNEGTPIQLIFYNLLGSAVKTQIINTYKTALTVSDLPDGIYILNGRTENGNVMFSKKISVIH
jgi:hypothetical protein